MLEAFYKNTVRELQLVKAGLGLSLANPVLSTRASLISAAPD